MTSAVQPLGMGASAPTTLQNAYKAPTTSYSVPLGGSTTYQKYQAPQASRTSATSTLGTLGTGGLNQTMSPMPERSPYSQPAGNSSTPSTSSQAAPRTGALTGPGAYEQWYQQNASRYNQPTASSSYWQQVQGRVQGQRFQPTAARGAYDQMSSRYSQPGQGMENAYDISGQLRNQTQGEGVMNAATAYYSQPNNMAQYYTDNRGFFGTPGDIENYYDANAGRFQTEGFGEKYAQGILQDSDLNSLYDNRLVGDELDYFRPELRNQSYSEQLYESGNEGLNQWYDLQRKRQTEDLENQLSAYGLFGSGEMVEGASRLREGLAAEQSRDMAGLAGQADAERRARADLLSGMANSASQEEVARGGLMLNAAGTGLQLDRDAIARLSAGGNLANMSSQYGLDRVQEGGVQANNADQSLFAQGQGLGQLGNMMSQQEINRLTNSGNLGMQADQEESRRLLDLYNAGMGVDNLGLQAQAADLSWLQAGSQMAGQADVNDLARLQSAGGAAQLAQTMYQDRERYGFQDPFAAASSMAGAYGGMASNNTSQDAAARTEAVNLLMQKAGLSAAEAERRAQEWASSGTLLTQLAALRYQ